MESILVVIALVVAILMTVLSLGFRNWFLAGVGVLIGIGSMVRMTGVNPFEWTADHWPTLVAGFALYAVTGALWAIFLWYRRSHSNKGRELIRKANREWKDAGSKPTESIKKYLPSRFYMTKAEVVWTMILWPFSVASYFLLDVVKDLFSWIYDRLQSVFTGITDHAIRSATKDD